MGDGAVHQERVLLGITRLYATKPSHPEADEFHDLKAEDLISPSKEKRNAQQIAMSLPTDSSWLLEALIAKKVRAIPYPNSPLVTLEG
jgi:hypothetical protein